MRHFSTKQAQWLVGIFLSALIIEAITFHFFSLFYFLAGVILLYFGFKYKKTSFYVVSCIFLLIAFVSLITLRIAIVAIAVYYIYHYYKKDKTYTLQTDHDLFVQHKRFIGTDETTESYAWKDVNIQRLAGIITIDATQTVLPRRTSVITARQLIGNVHIILPYDTPYRLVYTTVYGVATLPHDTKLLKNETLYHQEEDLAAVREIVIHVTTGLGDLEVSYQ